MIIASLLDHRSEITDTGGPHSAVVLMTRIRLARNLAGYPFPGWADTTKRKEVLAQCLTAVAGLPQMKNGLSAEIGDLSDLEKQILMERHLVSRELTGSEGESGVVISRDQSCSIMINEEDHLRIQVLKNGYNFKKVWSIINAIDDQLEEALDFAFHDRLGYLTACPTNVGTGIRASAMMHLPALVISSQMEKVVRAVNQLGIAVRGLFGEGSDASGSIFQISNQTTLGETEEEIIKRLSSVLSTIIEQELNARGKILEKDPHKLFDKMSRAFGILQHSYMQGSSETMNLLSLIRLGVDLGMFPEASRSLVDRLMIESQPGHITYASSRESSEPAARDVFRAAFLRNQFENMPKPQFNDSSAPNPSS